MDRELEPEDCLPDRADELIDEPLLGRRGGGAGLAELRLPALDRPLEVDGVRRSGTDLMLGLRRLGVVGRRCPMP